MAGVAATGVVAEAEAGCAGALFCALCCGCGVFCAGGVAGLKKIC